MARYRVRPTVDRISRVFIRNVKVQENLQLLQGETLKSNEEIIQKSYNYDMYDDAGTVSPNYPNGGPFAKPKFNGTVWIEGGDAFDVLLNGPTRPSTNDISIEMNVPKTSFNNDFEAEETVLYMEKDNRLVPISPFIGLNNVIGDFEGKMKNTTNLVSSKTNVNGTKQVDLSNLLSDLYVKMNKLDSNVIPDIYRGLLKRNNNDLNTIDSGFYQVPANATNMPTGIENDASNDAFLYVSSSNTKRNQILILTDGRMFSRLGTKSGSNITYQPWKKILGEDVGGLKKYEGDLNNVKEFGMYELGLSITNQPSNTLGTGFLMVFGIKSELFTALNQFIFISGRMFHRSFSDSSWTNWTNMDEIDLANFRDDINLNTENNRKVYFKTTDGQKVSLQEVFQSGVDIKNRIKNSINARTKGYDAIDLYDGKIRNFWRHITPDGSVPENPTWDNIINSVNSMYIRGGAVQTNTKLVTKTQILSQEFTSTDIDTSLKMKYATFATNTRVASYTRYEIFNNIRDMHYITSYLGTGTRSNISFKLTIRLPENLYFSYSKLGKVTNIGREIFFYIETATSEIRPNISLKGPFALIPSEDDLSVEVLKMNSRLEATTTFLSIKDRFVEGTDVVFANAITVGLVVNSGDMSNGIVVTDIRISLSLNSKAFKKEDGESTIRALNDSLASFYKGKMFYLELELDSALVPQR